MKNYIIKFQNTEADHEININEVITFLNSINWNNTFEGSRLFYSSDSTYYYDFKVHKIENDKIYLYVIDSI